MKLPRFEERSSHSMQSAMSKAALQPDFIKHEAPKQSFIPIAPMDYSAVGKSGAMVGKAVADMVNVAVNAYTEQRKMNDIYSSESAANELNLSLSQFTTNYKHNTPYSAENEQGEKVYPHRDFGEAFQQFYDEEVARVQRKYGFKSREAQHRFALKSTGYHAANLKEIMKFTAQREKEISYNLFQEAYANAESSEEKIMLLNDAVNRNIIDSKQATEIKISTQRNDVFEGAIAIAEILQDPAHIELFRKEHFPHYRQRLTTKQFDLVEKALNQRAETLQSLRLQGMLEGEGTVDIAQNFLLQRSADAENYRKYGFDSVESMQSALASASANLSRHAALLKDRSTKSKADQERLMLQERYSSHEGLKNVRQDLLDPNVTKARVEEALFNNFRSELREELGVMEGQNLDVSIFTSPEVQQQYIRYAGEGYIDPQFQDELISTLTNPDSNPGQVGTAAFIIGESITAGARPTEYNEEIRELVASIKEHGAVHGVDRWRKAQGYSPDSQQVEFRRTAWKAQTKGKYWEETGIPIIAEEFEKAFGENVFVEGPILAEIQQRAEDNFANGSPFFSDREVLRRTASEVVHEYGLDRNGRPQHNHPTAKSHYGRNPEVIAEMDRVVADTIARFQQEIPGQEISPDEFGWLMPANKTDEKVWYLTRNGVMVSTDDKMTFTGYNFDDITQDQASFLQAEKDAVKSQQAIEGEMARVLGNDDPLPPFYKAMDIVGDLMEWTGVAPAYRGHQMIGSYINEYVTGLPADIVEAGRQIMALPKAGAATIEFFANITEGYLFQNEMDVYAHRLRASAEKGLPYAIEALSSQEAWNNAMQKKAKEISAANPSWRNPYTEPHVALPPIEEAPELHKVLSDIALDAGA